MKITRGIWIPDVDDALRDALGEELEDVKEQVESGVSELWSIDDAGYLVTRFEIRKKNKVLVIVAGQKNKKCDTKYKDVVRAVERLARQVGANRLETEAKAKGIHKWLYELGFSVATVKYEKEI